MPSRVTLQFQRVQAMRPVLRRLYGRGWPLAVARGLLAARRLLRRTRWAGRSDPEASFVRGLALLPAIALDLRARLDGGAPAAVRELVDAVLDAENERCARGGALLEIADPRERWHAFFDRAVASGLHAFDERDCLSLEADRLHIRVFNCVLARLARDSGVPELALAGCERNAAFYRWLLPGHELLQSGPSASRLAGEQPYCEYVWQRRSARAGERAERPAAAERSLPLATEDGAASTRVG